MSAAEMDNGGRDSATLPVVRRSGGGNAGLWAFLAVLVLGGFTLFKAMETRRLESGAPITGYAGTSGQGVIAAPPPLVMPRRFAQMDDEAPLSAETTAVPASPAPTQRIVTRVVEVPAAPLPQPVSPAIAPSFPRPAIAYDSAAQPPRNAQQAQQGEERVLASRLQNPSLTVPKGTVIPAVLESALDSTQAGAARAIVSRDVLSFDGMRVLIPRGSKLYGEYGADINQGQNRALVRWTRLLRPDAVMINLDSQSADPLGRAGIKGKVNSHFFTRFGSAILQSVLDIGVGVATRSVTDSAVIVALPGSTPQISGQQQTEVRPTLTVKQGTSVSVFVSRDLDFSSVES